MKKSKREKELKFKIIYRIIILFALILFFYCFSGALYSTIKYANNQCNTSYLTSAGAFGVGLLAAVVQFVLLYKSYTESKRNKVLYTTKYISKNRDIIYPLFICLPRFKKGDCKYDLTFTFNQKTKEFEFKDKNLNLNNFYSFLIEYIKRTPSLLSRFVGPEEAAKYFAEQIDSIKNKDKKDKEKSDVEKIFFRTFNLNAKFFDFVNQICNLLDSFFQNYYNNMFDHDLADAYIDTVLSEIVDFMVYLVLLTRLDEMKNTKDTYSCDWRYLYRYIVNKFAK